MSADRQIVSPRVKVMLRDFPLKLGFGCSGAWGQKWFSERDAAALLDVALNAGVRHFDTAGFYADGEAERRLGATLAEMGVSPFVSTKTGTRYVSGRRPLKDFSEAGVRRDVEESLKRLKRERLDLLYLHGPDEQAIDAARGTLERLNAEGKIAAWGVCGEGAPLDHGLDAGASAFMAVYNVLRQAHGAFFARARAKGALTVAIAPLAQGLYARGFFKASSAADVWRIARALLRNRSEWAAARRLRATLEALEGWTPAGACLGFVQSDPNVALAMTTTTKQAHLRETLAAAERKFPQEFRDRLAAAGLDARQGGA